jgi:hypothetical protein
LTEGSGALTEVRYSVQDIDDQAEAIEAVEHDHVERSGRRTLLAVSVYMESFVIGATIRQAVDQGGIAVDREDHRPILGEVCSGRRGSRTSALSSRYI